MDLGVDFGRQYLEYSTYYNDSFFVALRPNEVYTFSPGINYRWLSISYAFTPQIMDINNDDDLRGTTSYRRLSTGLSFDQFSLHGSWSNTRGFYLANMGTVNAQWRDGDEYLQFPDMEIRRFDLNALYRTNANFSLKALAGGEEKQMRSAWSFLPGLNVQHFRFNTSAPDTTPGKVNLTRNLDINFVLPVAGTWVISKHFYLSGAAGPIVGVDFFNALAFDQNSEPTRSKGTRFSRGIYAKAHLVFNRPDWYAGVGQYVNSYRHSVTNNQRLAKTFTQFNLFGGLRIRPPKLLKNVMDWAERVVPLLQ